MFKYFVLTLNLENEIKRGKNSKNVGKNQRENNVKKHKNIEKNGKKMYNII